VLTEDSTGIELNQEEPAEFKATVVKVPTQVSDGGDIETFASEGLEIPFFTILATERYFEGEKFKTQASKEGIAAADAANTVSYMETDIVTTVPAAEITLEEKVAEEVPAEEVPAEEVPEEEIPVKVNAVEENVVDELAAEESSVGRTLMDELFANEDYRTSQVDNEVAPIIYRVASCQEMDYSGTSNSIFGTSSDEKMEVIKDEMMVTEEIVHDIQFYESDGEKEFGAYVVKDLLDEFEANAPVSERVIITAVQVDQVIVQQRYTCRLRCRKPGGLLRGPVLNLYCKCICRSGNY